MTGVAGLPPGVGMVMPPQPLALKTSAPGGLTLAQLAEHAAQAVQAIAADYPGVLRADVAELRALARAWTGTTDLPIVNDIYRKAHDIKGQAGTFGYELVGRIGASLCRMLDGARQGAGVPPQLVPLVASGLEVHVGAVLMVVDGNMKGAGGVVGETLMTGLDAVAEKIAGALASHREGQAG